MAKCSQCGAETLLYSRGVPICLECVEKNENPRRLAQTDKGRADPPDRVKTKTA